MTIHRDAREIRPGDLIEVKAQPRKVVRVRLVTLHVPNGPALPAVEMMHTSPAHPGVDYVTVTHGAQVRHIIA